MIGIIAVLFKSTGLDVILTFVMFGATLGFLFHNFLVLVCLLFSAFFSAKDVTSSLKRSIFAFLASISPSISASLALASSTASFAASTSLLISATFIRF